MGYHSGRVIEIQLDSQGNWSAWIACPAGAIPKPGQYVLAHDPVERGAPLATPLFPAAIRKDAFLAAPPVPTAWGPGTELVLWGALGRGFRLPAGLRRLACVALSETAARLLPVALDALEQGSDVTLFSDSTLPPIPSSLEVYPLVALQENLPWPELLALDLPVERLPELRALLGLDPDAALPCPAQALIRTPMPCAGIGECGACAVPARRDWLLACQKGPVFNLRELRW